MTNPYRGKCYETTFKMMESPDHPDLMRIIQAIGLKPYNPVDQLVLCHGMARIGGGREGHAWIEIDNRFTYDPAIDHLNYFILDEHSRAYECDDIKRFTMTWTIILSHYQKFPPPWNNLTDSDLKVAHNALMRSQDPQTVQE